MIWVMLMILTAWCIMENLLLLKIVSIPGESWRFSNLCQLIDRPFPLEDAILATSQVLILFWFTYKGMFCRSLTVKKSPIPYYDDVIPKIRKMSIMSSISISFSIFPLYQLQNLPSKVFQTLQQSSDREQNFRTPILSNWIHCTVAQVWLLGLF